MRYRRKTAKKREPEPIEKILKKVWKKVEHTRKERDELSLIFGEVKNFVGEKIGHHINSYRLCGKRLIVQVDSPAYLQELLFRKEAIVYAINRSFGKEKVKNINLRVSG